MASPPFNPSETTPADGSLINAFPAAERTFRDIIESWLLIEHGRSGHHTILMGTTTERDAITDWEVGSIFYNETTDRIEIVESIGPVVWIPGENTSVTQGTTTTVGGYEKATNAEVYAATADKVLTADLIEAASASVALVDAATVAVDWDAALNYTLVISANRVLGNPTNGQPFTSRKVYVAGSDATDRTLTFDSQYLGSVPALTDIDNGRAYLLYIDCISTTHFVVSAKRAVG